MPIIARPFTSSIMGLPADDFPVSPSTNVDSQQMQASPYQEIHSQREKRTSPPASAPGTAALSARFKAMDPPIGASPLATTSTSGYQDEEHRSHHLHPDSGFASSSLSPLMSGGSPSFSQQGRLRRQQLDPRRPSIQTADQRLASKASWSRKTSDLPSVSVPLGRSAEGGYSRTVSGQSRGGGRGPASSRHFLTVVPPEE